MHRRAAKNETFGPIDLFCSNAGISVLGGMEVDNESRQRIWEINVMAHVYAARAVIPGMIERGKPTITIAGFRECGGFRRVFDSKHLPEMSHEHGNYRNSISPAPSPFS
jgi:NAD(P)-dependent dehydrogenase (short-subunit alcohol dehydrogenase family)